MRLFVIGLIAFISLSSVARAQTARDEGIRALVRGDYIRAAEILRPLAEDAQAPDQTARLIIAMLNDGGYAGQGGTLRACALYISAAATPGPFTQPATVLARMIREELGDGARLCEDERFLNGPVTFRNGPAVPSAASPGFLTLARGDVDAAAGLLKELAESDTSRDHVAQFLMGTLYHSGRGAPADPLRACALYHRASNVSDSPFSAAATRLMRGLWREHDNEWFAHCQALGNLGLDHGFEPVTYDLGPGRTITWDFAGAKLINQGQATEFPWRGPRGAVYLPLQHTTLHTGPAQERRDFIEIFFWSPSGARWKLARELFEVDGSEVRYIHSAADLLVSDHRPRAGETVDVRKLVTLRVNSAGLAEWTVVGDKAGPAETIESPNERRQRRDEEAAREAALARVDWKRTFETWRTPSLQYSGAEGCGRLSISAFSADHGEVIHVFAERPVLAAAPAAQRFDIAREPRVTVNVHMYERPMRNSPFCTDVGHNVEEQVWRAVSGTVTIEVSAPGVTPREPRLYRATVRIDGAEFVSPAGQRVRQTRPIVLSALAGRFAGGG